VQKGFTRRVMIMFENFWEFLLTGILLWIFVDEFVPKSGTRKAAQPIVEKITGKNIRPV